MRGLEVRDADRAHLAARVHPLHRLPGLDVVADCRHRPVDQEEVHIVEIESLQRVVERRHGRIRIVVRVRQLARDEDVLALQPGFAHCLADLELVAVQLGGVDVAVAGLERPEGRGFRVRGRDLEGAEPELRDFDTVVERDRRHGSHVPTLARQRGPRGETTAPTRRAARQPRTRPWPSAFRADTPSPSCSRPRTRRSAPAGVPARG